jgi:transcription initiation factor TFIIIB Brf1 subunit/transcription initiation factor TFIIB
MVEALAWSQFDQLFQPKPVVVDKDDEFFCSCGGVKSFQYEFPTCTICGVMDSCILSDEPEWISGGGDGETKDLSRVGAPQNIVLYSDAWGMGTIIKGKNCQKMAKISFHSSMNHKDRALHNAYKEFNDIAQKIKVPEKIINDAKIVYRKFNEEKLTRGAIRLGIKANCVIYACKLNGVSRSTSEVADAFDIPVRDVSRTNDMFRETTGEDLGESAGANDIVKRIFNSILCVPDEKRGRIKMKIVEACKAAEQKPELLGKTPKGISSAVVFKVLTESGYQVDRAVIASICGVSVPTLVKIEKLL